MKRLKPVVLMILDGWGLSPSWGGNALAMNNPKYIDKLWKLYPHKVLQALGAIQYGNIVGESRLGHLMIGAGRPVTGHHSRINRLISTRQFYKNKVLLDAFNWAKKNDSNVHLLGLISDAGVHSDVDHLLALLDIAHRKEFDRVFVDAITDGVDTGPQDALKFIDKIEKKMTSLNLGQFSSLLGRHYAMDRNENWKLIRQAYDCISGNLPGKSASIKELISAAYRKNQSDDQIVPSLIKDKKGNTHPIKDGDAVIFFNFREDRAVELTKTFAGKNFKQFLWKPKQFKNLYFCGFSQYEKNLPTNVAFPEKIYQNNLSEILSLHNCKQLKLAESEKKSHVTSFFNGGSPDPYSGEEIKIIDSPNVASYDLRPKMSAEGLKKIALQAIASKKYDFILINFANVDMIAHTGNITAVGEAVKALDTIVAQITKENLKSKGVTIITADHGNAEQMSKFNSKERETLHTLNPVPFILITPYNRKDLAANSVTYGANSLSKIMGAQETLADIAPTILEIMGLPKPVEMTGRSLLSRLE